jgi:hypothetical protein
MKINVAILVTSCKHGTEYDVFPTQALAWEALYDYVNSFWDELHDAGPIPKDEQEAVDIYFEKKAYDEWWEITVRTLDISGLDLRSLTSDEEEIR